jgi:hypothetical protein
MATIADQFRAHLIAEGIGRSPRDAADLSLAPIWVNKANTPAPGEGGNATEQGRDAVINLVRLDGIPAQPMNSMIRTDLVEARIRSYSWPLIERLYALIRDVTIDRFGWPMGTWTVISSQEWTALAMVDATDVGGRTLYSGRAGVVFETYAAAHLAA